MEFKKSKEEYVAEMKEIAKDSIADPERAHEGADEFLYEILIKEEYLAEMKEIAKNSAADPERAHEHADELLCKILIKEGYKEVVDVFKDVYKLYA